MGDRMALMGRAVALLSRHLPSGCRMYLSDYVESEPWGYDSDNLYLNRGILIITPCAVDPHAMLDITQGIETAIAGSEPHRNPDGSYRDRPIDIDIIDIDGLQIHSDRLILPHPRARLRPFVYGPMAALNAVYPAEAPCNIELHISDA